MERRSLWVRIAQSALVSAVIVVLLFANQFFRVREELERQSESRLDTMARVLDREFEDLVRVILVFSLSAQMEDYLAEPSAANRERLDDQAKTILELNPEFDRIRLVDQSGKVILNTGRDGHTPVAEHLPRLTESAFDRLIAELSPGQIRYAEFALKRTGGEILLPHVPLFRVACLVGGSSSAVVSIDLAVSEYLRTVEELFPDAAEDFYLLNASGEWLIAENPSMEWAVDFSARQEFALPATRPGFWKRIEAERAGQAYDGTTLYTWRWVRTPGDEVASDEDDERFHLLLSGITLATTLSQTARLLPLLGIFFALLTASGAFGLWILDRRRQEREEARSRLVQINQELTRSNEELQQFAYVASHDLQEPLRMVSSYTQLLNRRYGDQLDEKARKWIFYAVDGATRMQQLIDDLLQFSRLTTREPQPEAVRLDVPFDRALQNLSALIAENDAVITREELPEVHADPARLTMLFQNLISNAIRYRRDAPPEITLTCEQIDAGRFWRIGVRDNGIGIDPKYHEKVFVIFQRLHSRAKYPGTGIGLAVCKKIVESVGGKISYESEEGSGTTFYFTMPSEFARNDKS